MNHFIPEWNFEADLPISNHKKPMGEDNELVELLWQNGQVVLHSQTHRKHGANQNESRQVQQYEQPATTRGGLSYGNSSSLIHDDETVSWIHYPIEDSFEKEFCSDFFSELSMPNAVDADKHDRQLEKERFVKSASSTAINVIANPRELNVNSIVSAFPRNPTPPPKFQIDTAFQSKKLGNLVEDINFSQFSAPFKGHMGGSSNGQFEGKGSGSMTRESSGMTFGSSHCGSNQVRNDVDFSRASSDGIGTTNGLSAGSTKDNVQKEVGNSDIGKTETREPAVSSSDGSGSSFGRTCKESTGVGSQKRKSIDGEETECQSEAVELESAARNKLSQRAKPPHRSRAAEVHNLSERRRRDRINKKMRALQELIPHCNKTDKASMLDEAIEYLKSLQLQLQVSQVMWMGSRMTPMMFPGVQHYMPRMAMGMSLPTMSPIHNSMHLPRIPVGDHSAAMAPPQNQAVISQTQVPNPVRFQNRLQNSTFPEQYAQYMGFRHMQAASQAMNVFGYDSRMVQQSKMTSQPGCDCRPSAGGPSANGDASLH